MLHLVTSWLVMILLSDMVNSVNRQSLRCTMNSPKLWWQFRYKIDILHSTVWKSCYQLSGRMNLPWSEGSEPQIPALRAHPSNIHSMYALMSDSSFNYVKIIDIHYDCPISLRITVVMGGGCLNDLITFVIVCYNYGFVVKSRRYQGERWFLNLLMYLCMSIYAQTPYQTKREETYNFVHTFLMNIKKIQIMWCVQPIGYISIFSRICLSVYVEPPYQTKTGRDPKASTHIPLYQKTKNFQNPREASSQ